MKQRNFIKTIKEKGDTKMNNEKIYSLRLTESAKGYKWKYIESENA